MVKEIFAKLSSACFLPLPYISFKNQPDQPSCSSILKILSCLCKTLLAQCWVSRGVLKISGQSCRVPMKHLLDVPRVTIRLGQVNSGKVKLGQERPYKDHLDF